MVGGGRGVLVAVGSATGVKVAVGRMGVAVLVACATTGGVFCRTMLGFSWKLVSSEFAKVRDCANWSGDEPKIMT